MNKSFVEQIHKFLYCLQCVTVLMWTIVMAALA
jgi:hypothetical protein